MLYAILKIIFKVSLRVFFRKIEVRNRHLIPEQGPLLIVANHPNTFMDPIAIAAITRQEIYFIAKSTVFKTPWRSYLLQKMNLVPVYRRQDEGASVWRNADTFRKCFELLSRKGTLLIFPEGNSFNERRLRPLKTGAARIALEAEALVNFGGGTQIVPVGLNYTDPSRFQSSLFINVGAPIAVADFRGLYQQDAFHGVAQLNDKLRQRLEDLLVITSTAEEDELVAQVEAIYKYDLRKALGLTQRQQDKFVLTKAIADSIRYFFQHDPSRVQVLQDKIQAYKWKLEKLGLQDRFLKPTIKDASLLADALKTMLYLVLGFPVYLFGLLTNYIPYIIPSKVADKLVREQEFRAPVMMTTGIFSFLFFYGLEIWGTYRFTASWEACILIGGLLPVTGFFAWQYYYRWVNTQGYLRLFTLFYRRQQLVQQVLKERAAIIKNLEAAKEVYMRKLGADS